MIPVAASGHWSAVSGGVTSALLQPLSPGGVHSSDCDSVRGALIVWCRLHQVMPFRCTLDTGRILNAGQVRFAHYLRRVLNADQMRFKCI